YLHFFLTYPPTSTFYTLSLHDALPIFVGQPVGPLEPGLLHPGRGLRDEAGVEVECRADADQQRRLEAGTHPRHPLLLLRDADPRSEEHTSELQSLRHLVCRLLLEKKKT